MSNCLSLCRVALFSLFCLDSKQEAEPVVRGTKTSNYHLACSVVVLFCLRNKQKTTQFQAIRRPLFYNERHWTCCQESIAISPSKQATSLEMRWMSLNDFQPSQTKTTCVCLEFKQEKSQEKSVTQISNFKKCVRPLFGDGHFEFWVILRQL